MNRFNSDIDIDFGDRDLILKHIQHTPAAMYNVDPPRKHNTGIHVTDVPYNPVYDIAALSYTEAEERGYVKLDMLNVYVYRFVRDEQHLVELMREPNWALLLDKANVEQLIHIGNHWETLQLLEEPIDSIPRLAMFIALIRPGKRHLIGKSWAEIGQTIWEKEQDGYSFKKSHSVAYAHLVAVHMNLIAEGSAKLFSLD